MCIVIGDVHQFIGHCFIPLDPCFYRHYLLRINPSKNNEYNFWSEVPVPVIRQFVQVYLLDFLIFGYSARDYLDNLNISYDADIITV